jgi:hypothetical protein
MFSVFLAKLQAQAANKLHLSHLVPRDKHGARHAYFCIDTSDTILSASSKFLSRLASFDEAGNLSNQRNALMCMEISPIVQGFVCVLSWLRVNDASECV